MSNAYLHRGGADPLRGTTLDEAFRAVVAQHGPTEACVFVHQDRRMSWDALDAATDRLAAGLIGLGLQRGDRLGVWATDHLEWLLLQLATARVGVVLVTVNPAYRQNEVAFALKRARVNALFLIPAFKSSRYVEMVQAIVPELASAAPGTWTSAALPELRHVVVWDPENPDATERPAPGFHVWREVADGRGVDAAEVQARTASLQFDDPINIQFTSGTTGSPKPVVLTHHNILNNAWFVAEAMRFGSDDRLCVPLPFYHCFGLVLSTLLCVEVGATIVVPAQHFDPEATLRALAEERCTAVHGVPTMFVALLEHRERLGLETPALRTGIMAGAPCPPVLLRRVMSELGCDEILVAYGQTEASPVTHITRFDDSFDHRVQTVGTNLPHQEVKVVDPESGEIVDRGVQGEVCFRGYHVMQGYFEDPEATARAIDAAGWLHSGDLGVMEEDGYLRITGRLKDMVIRGGENIYPAEIEAVFHDHPDVVDIAVFGVPDERMGEEVGAFLRLRDGAVLDESALRAWARERMAHFKVPRFFWAVEAFPMTVTGKVQKFRMRELAAGWLAEA